MVRTQIYLTKSQRDELAILAKALGIKQSQLIRDAIDRLINQTSHSRREEILRLSAGLWKDRTDLPDFRSIRAGWDRK
jgi:hypothetical protein